MYIHIMYIYIYIYIHTYIHTLITRSLPKPRSSEHSEPRKASRNKVVSTWLQAMSNAHMFV